VRVGGSWQVARGSTKMKEKEINKKCGVTTSSISHLKADL